MKTMQTPRRSLPCCVAVLILVGLAWYPFLLPAQEIPSGKSGATKLIQLKPIRTAADAEQVKPGDEVVMSCPKCKDTWVNVVEKPEKTGAKPDTKTYVRHECPGCGTKLVIEGQGKARTDKIVHVCTKCGSEDAFCCVMKKDSKPTPGMEKK